MGYIAFLDLLGTKDFSGDPEVYTDSISRFYSEAKRSSYYLKDYGNIGIFSDCLYAESRTLKELLDYLVILRKKLLVHNLFFNAAVTTGEIGIINQASSENANFWGVAFENSEIAKVYMLQNKFKGIGLWIDPDLYGEMPEKYQLVKSVYLPDVDRKELISYRDIAFELTHRKYDNFESGIINIALKQCLLSYTKSKRYGRYYLSLLTTLINSSKGEIEWDRKNQRFKKCPPVFSVIMELAEAKGEGYPEIQGLFILCLFVVEKAFQSDTVLDLDRKMIVKKFMSYRCLSEPYAYSISELPNVFDGSFREKFIQIYQNDIVNKQVDTLLHNQNRN